MSTEYTRYNHEELSDFVIRVLQKLGVPRESAMLAGKSLIEASLMGIDTHGVEALDMYATHIQRGGLNVDNTKLRLLAGKGGLELWDMENGFGLAEARRLMSHAINRAQELGIYMLTCRNANHIGACGIYGKMAADKGLIGIVSQQTTAAFAPASGIEPRVGASPFAFVAPIEDSFPFYFDASMAAITRGQIKNFARNGALLPTGVALDRHGNPTVIPSEAWDGKLLPIGNHKGLGLAMGFEILSCVLSGNRFASQIPSIVDNPKLSAGSSVFMIVIDPVFVKPAGDFAQSMGAYIDYIESAMNVELSHLPSYPGQMEGQNLADRLENGIPVSGNGLERMNRVAKSLGIEVLRLPVNI